MHIQVRPIKPSEFANLIVFDQVHLLEVMKKIGVEEEKCPPIFTLAEINAAYERNDVLVWLLVDNEIAGYMWREIRPGYLFGSGAAIKDKFYGRGLSDYIIKFTEQTATERGLTVCKLAVIPVNGRVISAYMRHGFRITGHIMAYSDVQSPGLFRCIMEKNLRSNQNKNRIEDRVEVSSVDDNQIKYLIDNGYIGARFVKRGNGELLVENKIVFEKYSSFLTVGI